MTDVRFEMHRQTEKVWGSSSSPTVSWRVLARKPDNADAFLIVDGDDTTEPYPRLARVLDRALLRAYPPYATEALLRASQWELVQPDEEVDVEALLENVHVEPVNPFHERFLHEPSKATSSGSLANPLSE